MKHIINHLPITIGLSLAASLSQAMEPSLQGKVAAAHQQFIKSRVERIAERLGIQVPVPVQVIHSNSTVEAEEESDYVSPRRFESSEEESSEGRYGYSPYRGSPRVSSFLECPVSDGEEELSEEENTLKNGELPYRGSEIFLDKLRAVMGDASESKEEGKNTESVIIDEKQDTDIIISNKERIEPESPSWFDLYGFADNMSDFMKNINSLDTKTGDDCTILHACVYHGDVMFLKYALENGALILPSKTGRYAYDVSRGCAIENYEECRRLVREAFEQKYPKLTDEQLYDLINSGAKPGDIEMSQCEKLSDMARHIFAVFNNTAPTILDLTDRKINDSIAVVLAQALTHNTSITSLKLHNNQIEDIGASKLAEALLHNKSLLRLFLHRNQIGPVGATHLARSLHCNDTLRTLHLYDNKIGDEGAIELGKALSVNNSLSWLQIGRNQITNIAFEALKEGVMSNQSLTVFNIEGNAMSESCRVALQKLRIKGKRCIVMEGSKYLSQPFIQQQDNDDDYGRVFQTDEHLYDLINSGAKPGDIEESQCKKLSDTARHIFSIFNNTAQTILGLSDHSDNDHAGMVLCRTDRVIDDRIATVLAKALTHNTTITDIDMRHNLIGDVGAAELMNVLRTNTTLTSLVFYQNRIGDEGAAKIAEVLSHNTTLKWLFLNKNHITDVGAVKIANALATNTTLTTLNLNYNQIGEVGKAALLANRSSNLTALEITAQQEDLISEDGYYLSDLRLIWTCPTDRYKTYHFRTDTTDKQLYEIMLLPTNLERAVLSACTGLSDTAKMLCDVYFNVPLVNIHLESIKMDDLMAAALGKTLARNTKTTTLDLRYNGLTTVGAAHVGQGLAANTGLSSIILYEHHMGEAGTFEIAKSLLTNRTLRDFEIWGQISEGCAAIYAEVLRTNTTLTRLALYNSQVNNMGAIELTKGLKGNTTLKVLSLHSNLIGDAGASAIVEALVGNTTLSALNLGNNLLSDSMKETLKQNPSVNLEVFV